MSAASRLKITVLWEHVEEMLLLNKFFLQRAAMLALQALY